MGDPGLPIMVGLLAVPVAVLLFVISLAMMGRRWTPAVAAEAEAGGLDTESGPPAPFPAYPAAAPGSYGREPYALPAPRPTALPAARPPASLPPAAPSPRALPAAAPRALPAGPAPAVPPSPPRRPASPWERYDAEPPRAAEAAEWEPYVPPARPPREPAARSQEPRAPRPYRLREHDAYGPPDPRAQAAAARRWYETAGGAADEDGGADGHGPRDRPTRRFPFDSYDPSDPFGGGPR